NYGDGKYIGFGRPAGSADSKAVVIVPAETQELFQTGVVEELVKACRTYPIRIVRKDRYRFTVAGGEHIDWESVADYPTAAEAHYAFDLFRLLLDFPGNYFIETDWKECRYRVGLREVLAESTHRYHDERAAWGPRGVEKFICVAQAAGGFHLNRRADC